MFDLPPNLPQDDTHWYGRRLPGTEVEFADAADAAALIAAVQTRRGMLYDPDNPMGAKGIRDCLSICGHVLQG